MKQRLLRLASTLYSSVNIKSATQILSLIRYAFQDQLTIGFDIDDTLANLNTFLVKELNSRGYPVKHEDRTESKWEQVADLAIPPEVLTDIFKQAISTGKLATLDPIAGVRETLSTLKKEGIRIVLITSRPEKYMGTDTRKWLEYIGIPYDALYFARNKSEIAEKENVDLFLDDESSYIRQFDESPSEGIFLTQPWNINQEGSRITTVPEIVDRTL